MLALGYEPGIVRVFSHPYPQPNIQPEDEKIKKLDETLKRQGNN